MKGKGKERERKKMLFVVRLFECLNWFCCCLETEMLMWAVNFATSSLNRFQFTIIKDFAFIDCFNAGKNSIGRIICRYNLFSVFICVFCVFRQYIDSKLQHHISLAIKRVCDCFTIFIISEMVCTLCCSIATTCRLMHERPFLRWHVLSFIFGANRTSTMADHFANLFK